MKKKLIITNCEIKRVNSQKINYDQQQFKISTRHMYYVYVSKNLYK